MVSLRLYAIVSASVALAAALPSPPGGAQKVLDVQVCVVNSPSHSIPSAKTLIGIQGHRGARGEAIENSLHSFAWCGSVPFSVCGLNSNT
jgi:hypothetical protein